MDGTFSPEVPRGFSVRARQLPLSATAIKIRDFEAVLTPSKSSAPAERRIPSLSISNPETWRKHCWRVKVFIIIDCGALVMGYCCESRHRVRELNTSFMSECIEWASRNAVYRTTIDPFDGESPPQNSPKLICMSLLYDPNKTIQRCRLAPSEKVDVSRTSSGLIGGQHCRGNDVS